jgi:LacI family transcriptional regulator
MVNQPTQPTIYDIADHAGVSIATVSRVLNGTSVVLPDKLERVRNAIEELNYSPRRAARELAKQKTETIGLVVPEISRAYFSQLLRGIEMGARAAGFDLLVYSNDIEHEGHITHRPIGKHNADGLLVFTQSLSTQDIIHFHRIGFPLVLIAQPSPESLMIPSVRIENQGGAFTIMKHLILVHQRRKIVFLKGESSQEDALCREQGYFEALKTYNIQPDPDLIAYGGFNADVAKEAIRNVLEKGIKFDAVFSSDDDSASGVLLALREANLRVPEDVSVVGFDDAPFAPYLTPPLTTVFAPTEQVGLEAIRLLVRLIQGEKVEPVLILPTKPVIRESCGCLQA